MVLKEAEILEKFLYLSGFEEKYIKLRKHVNFTLARCVNSGQGLNLKEYQRFDKTANKLHKQLYTQYKEGHERHCERMKEIIRKTKKSTEFLKEEQRLLKGEPNELNIVESVETRYYNAGMAKALSILFTPPEKYLKQTEQCSKALTIVGQELIDLMKNRSEIYGLMAKREEKERPLLVRVRR